MEINEALLIILNLVIIESLLSVDNAVVLAKANAHYSFIRANAYSIKILNRARELRNQGRILGAPKLNCVVGSCGDNERAVAIDRYSTDALPGTW